MRWLFLLLLVLNAFYAVWHQQEAPVRPKELAPLSVFKGAHRDIQLLSEGSQGRCALVGGMSDRARLELLQVRLSGTGVDTVVVMEAGAYWLKVEGDGKVEQARAQLNTLTKEFNDLKHKIIRCEGIATAQ